MTSLIYNLCSFLIYLRFGPKSVQIGRIMSFKKHSFGERNGKDVSQRLCVVSLSVFAWRYWGDSQSEQWDLTFFYTKNNCVKRGWYIQMNFKIWFRSKYSSLWCSLENELNIRDSMKLLQHRSSHVSVEELYFLVERKKSICKQV